MSDYSTGFVITSIERHRSAAVDDFHFGVTLRGPTTTILAAVPAHEMLEYFRFQCHILKRHGVVFRHSECEGRVPTQANEAWCGIVQGFLENTACAITIIEHGKVSTSNTLGGFVPPPGSLNN